MSVPLTPERLAEIRRLQHDGPFDGRAAITDLLDHIDALEEEVKRLRERLTNENR